MLFVHGHGAYLMHELLNVPKAGKPPKYKDSWVEKLNQEGFSVCGIDQQGCGFSEGLECYVDRFDHYIDDVLQFARLLPIAQLFVGAILFAPMLSLERASKHGLNYYLRPLAALLSRIWPTLPAASTTRNHLYPELQSLWDADPLCWHGATRARVANEYLLATEAGLKEMPSYTFPFIVFHGADDTLTDPDGSRTLYERSQTKDKTFRLIEKRWHVLLKEPGNAEILQEVIAWLKART
ncbi:alpha/beta-hydrolase [Coccomyxa subellipsoidea C-169]|uniref:Alpha/beta-hydrolase n=1 Tax=Coccomyxa subellipsoidea (strain C-169) TaxID=574566 RepID=I0Z4I2_COCSC|nr:alpha/beta-hydrolase [Coccomyxa subellipsoidea C-169]EIE25551.1 alpha/beta-hydrolase [Coccomyxa subellipsoidea C-169]|eukprot:XP_005650095.1 alpha/beta-hydrolase [Coccomyxa subellipsoidea C-169]